MGERIGAYELERRLGAGGMAEVFLARRCGPEGFAKKVALKRVLPAFNADPDFVRLFQDEARLAAHLDHPHIASIHDFGIGDGSWYMAMELVDGIDLQTLLTGLKAIQHPLPVELGLLLAVDLASALLYAHELVIEGRAASIVHRDVSPSNVLIDVHGNIKLADFGIARAATHGHHTRTGVIKGKVPYMPPEQALGETFDHRVDLFALGVVVYEALAGRRPFHGATELDTLHRICKGTHADLREVAPHVPEPLAAVVERLIRTDASERFASAAEVHDALAATPPPTNARRLLGSLVRRVRELAAPRSEPTAPVPVPPVAPPVSMPPTPPMPPLSPLPPAPSMPSLSSAPPSAPPISSAPPPLPPLPPPAAEIVPEPSVLAGPAPETRITPRSARPPRSPAVAIPCEPDPPVLDPGDDRFGLGASAAMLDLSPTPSFFRGTRLTTLAVALLSLVALGTAGVVVIIAVDGSGEASAAPSPSNAPVPDDKIDVAPPPPATSAPIGSPRPTAREREPIASLPPAPPSPRVEPPVAADDDRDRPLAPPPARAAPEPPRRAAPSRGRLQVVALPIGTVTIDGRHHAEAPVTVSLSAGRHTVVVTHGDRSERRTIEIAPGQTERVIVRFVP